MTNTSPGLKRAIPGTIGGLASQTDMTVEDMSFLVDSIITGVENSASIKRIMRSNNPQSIVEITPAELKTLIVDYILEQKDRPAINKLPTNVYHSIGYVAEYMFKLAMGHPDSVKVLDGTYQDAMSNGNPILAGDIAVYDYLFGSNGRRTGGRKEGLLDMAHSAYFKGFRKNPGIADPLVQEVVNVEGFVNMILVSYGDAALARVKSLNRLM